MAEMNDTEYDAMTAKVQGQVDNLRESLWKSSISPEALERKLARHKFGDVEKNCIRFAFRATRVEDHDAEALASEWGAFYDDEISGAIDAALTEAERTGDYRRFTRLHELESMADSCVETALMFCH